MALDSCNPCSSLADLQTAANNYLVAHNPGPQSLLLLETSLNAPISAFFQETSQTVCIPYTGCFSYPIMTNITPDNMGRRL